MPCVIDSIPYRSNQAPWLDQQVTTIIDIPSPWRLCLLDQGSPTQHLIFASKGTFQVQIPRQEVGRPQRSEQNMLNMPIRSLALIREVLLYGNDQPWVFARSILPLSSLTGRQRHLRKLGNQALGALLFADPLMRRGAIQISRIKAEALAPLSGVSSSSMSLWAGVRYFISTRNRFWLVRYFYRLFALTISLMAKIGGVSCETTQ